MSYFIYRLRDKKSGKYFDGWNATSTEDRASEYKTVAGAQSALSHFVHRVLGQKLYTSSNRGNSYAGLTDETLKKWFPYEMEIVKTEVIYKDAGATDQGSVVRNMFISNKLQDTSYALARFWDNAIKKEYADKIEYVMQLNIARGAKRMDKVKEARAQLRLLGVKTRTFREYEGMFGFYNKDQAFKARLTLDVLHSIDITEIKKELFS